MFLVLCMFYVISFICVFSFSKNPKIDFDSTIFGSTMVTGSKPYQEPKTAVLCTNTVFNERIVAALLPLCLLGLL